MDSSCDRMRKPPWGGIAVASGIYAAWLLFLAPQPWAAANAGSIAIDGVRINRVAAYYYPWASGCYAGLAAAMFVLRERRALSVATFAALVIALVGLVFGGRWQARLEYMPVAQALLVPPRDLLGPSPMKLTWLGHSAFRIEAGAAKSLIDPFLSDNPSWDKGWSGYLAGKNSTQGGDR